MNSKNKKILIVSYDFPPKLGGVATCAGKLASSLAKMKDVQVRVVAPHSAQEATDSIGNYQIKRSIFSRSPKLSFLFFTWSVICELFFWRPNFIVNLLWFPDGLATYIASRIIFWRKTPYFLFAHAVEVMETEITFKKRLRKRLSFLKVWTFQKAKGVFAVSRFTKNLVMRNCSVPDDRVVVVHNGVEPKDFFPTGKSDELVRQFNSKNKTVFLTIARLCDYKGIDQALKAFKELKKTYTDFIYLIGGLGPDEARLKRLTKKYGLEENVIFLGKLPESELNTYYNFCDCFILLSRQDIWTPNVEGFGIVFLEAAACGKPVIAGNSGGVPDAVEDHKSGWIVSPRDTSAILNRMSLVISNSQQVEAMKKYAELRARGFSWDKTAQFVMESANNVRN